MTNVKLTQPIGTHQPGDTITVTPGGAAMLIANGAAETIEAATTKQPSTKTKTTKTPTKTTRKTAEADPDTTPGGHPQPTKPSTAG